MKCTEFVCEIKVEIEINRHHPTGPARDFHQPPKQKQKQLTATHD